MVNAPSPVTIRTHRLTTSNNNLTIEYPFVSGLANSSAEERINNHIYTLVNSLIVTQGYYQNPNIIVAGWYEIKTNERNILSLTICNDAHNPQYPHGLTIIKSLTFNVSDGKLYNLDDLFTQNSNYMSRLSDIIKIQIKDRNMSLLREFKSILPNQDYYVADKSIVIYFQLYQLTPYDSGFPFFPISVYDIKDIIKPEPPLSDMVVCS